METLTIKIITKVDEIRRKDDFTILQLDFKASVIMLLFMTGEEKHLDLVLYNKVYRENVRGWKYDVRI